LTIASGASASLHYYKRDAAHAHPNVDHEYPSHSLVFTDVGEWQYHETERRATVDTRVLVAGTGLRHYACSHQRGMPNECFIVAVKHDALDDDGDRLFPKSVLNLTPEMLLHRRAIAAAASDSERLESLAFSLYDVVARAGATQSRKTAFDVRMSYAKRVIQELCAKPVTVAVIARELHLSRFTFTRRFLAHESMAPHAYMTKLRITRATEMLRTTTLTIDEIAAATGFGSIAHFSSAFHRIVGYTPTAFRRLSAR
jgi:AraC-like DNA-binding protein